jgi:hypothetical protein
LRFLNYRIVGLRWSERGTASADRAHDKQYPNYYEPVPGAGGSGFPLP